MNYFILTKDNLDNFISTLAKTQKVVAPLPVGYNQFAFSPVTTAKDIKLDYIPTILPPKKYFFPQEDKLASFDLNQGQRLNPIAEQENMVIFGLHSCDLAGIQCLNMVFNNEPKDINYITRQNKIALIGYECNFYCDQFASCRLVHNHLPNGGYDLFFTNIGSEFLVHVNSPVGQKIIDETQLFIEASQEHLNLLEEVRQKKREIFQNEVPIAHEQIAEMFSRSFDHPVWTDLDQRCVACGNCTNVCPSCYCFDIIDEIDLNLKTGRRYRRWDSCQNEPFAKVASGENFRRLRGSRQRHRYYRKFSYPLDRYSRFFCTGCGRCSRTCMAQIHLKETLNVLIKDYQPK